MPMEVVRNLPYDHPYRWDGTLFGGPKLWRPTEIQTSLWLDAEDSTTITLNGTTVSQWNDKSGNGINVSQATATSQPAYSATGLNGKPVIEFDGIDDVLSIGETNLGRNLAGMSAAVVLKWVTAPATSKPLIAFSISGAQLVRFSISGISPNYAFGGRRLDGVSAQTVTGNQSLLTTTTAAISSVVVNYQNTAVDLYTNGIVDRQTTTFLTSGNTSDTSSFLFNIGKNSSTADFANVQVSEVVFTNSALSERQRQQLEGYLAWKWRLEANLPVSHPYKNLPPTV